MAAFEGKAATRRSCGRSRRPQRGLPRGYKLPAAARPILTAAAKTDLRRSTLTALGDMAMFIGAGVAAAVAHATLPAAAAWAISVVAIVFMGRTGRALECMVHEASHRNWQRQGRWNDLLANVMAGFPTASQVGEYRASHMVHHARLGSDDDPDIIRYEKFDLESMTGLSGWQLIKGVVRRLPAYNWSWYTAIGTSAVTLALSGAWYAVVIGGVSLAGGAQLGLVTWLHMLVGFGLALPGDPHARRGRRAPVHRRRHRVQRHHLQPGLGPPLDHPPPR